MVKPIVMARVGIFVSGESEVGIGSVNPRLLLREDW